MRNAMVGVTLFLLVASGGCGSSKPSEENLETVIRRIVPSHAKLVTFHKTNGIAEPPLRYRVEWEAEIELTEDCYFRNGRFENTVKYINSLPESSPTKVIFNNKQTVGSLMVKKQGERQRISGSHTFAKTEKGWR
jgi:hypothetical protein